QHQLDQEPRPRHGGDQTRHGAGHEPDGDQPGGHRLHHAKDHDGRNPQCRHFAVSASFQIQHTQGHQGSHCRQPPHSGPFVGRGQVAHKISQRRFQCPGLHPLRRRRRLLAAQGDLLAEQVIHGDAVAVADIDDLLKLRVSPAGLPLAHRLPGD
ncbi:hypothetical protein AJOOGB_AJOOGB_14380, partial [Dysosmobacter welbionis]